mmetsp:Transcript_38062/g.94598  ORF Transcript_38062/g.94598 Transcript_38062/m.94598 type:complete len:276 (-) Transcript_38062:486-1313(-)
MATRGREFMKAAMQSGARPWKTRRRKAISCRMGKGKSMVEILYASSSATSASERMWYVRESTGGAMASPPSLWRRVTSRTIHEWTRKTRSPGGVSERTTRSDWLTPPSTSKELAVASSCFESVEPSMKTVCPTYSSAPSCPRRSIQSCELHDRRFTSAVRTDGSDLMIASLLMLWLFVLFRGGSLRSAASSPSVGWLHTYETRSCRRGAGSLSASASCRCIRRAWSSPRSETTSDLILPEKPTPRAFEAIVRLTRAVSAAGASAAAAAPSDSRRN